MKSELYCNRNVRGKWQMPPAICSPGSDLKLFWPVLWPVNLPMASCLSGTGRCHRPAKAVWVCPEQFALHFSFESWVGSLKSHPVVNIAEATSYLRDVSQTIVQSSFWLLMLNKIYSIHISHSGKCNLFPAVKRPYLIVSLQNVNWRWNNAFTIESKVFYHFSNLIIRYIHISSI